MQSDIPDKLLKPYDPQSTESRIYDRWLESGYFNPDKCVEDGITDKDAEVFSIVLPPPNVTGTLHMGSAFMVAIEDIMVRFARMRGKKTLWIPGTDHAAIATQSKVESEIYKKEGKRRHELGREELLKRINVFAKENHDRMVEQFKRLGGSLDWSREAYTLDDKRNLAVRTAFKKMYDDKLIYRKYRVVNWDPKGQTTISDDEIVYTENKGKLYTFRYSKDFPISISTTRPETKVGDVAVAVNPGDERYKQYIGKEYDIDFVGEKIHIKIVEDTAADIEFGTGAIGVTPAHSIIDYEIAQRNALPIKPVINELGKMSVESKLLAGKKVLDARIAVVEWLKEQNLLEKEGEIIQNIATAERTGGVIEPLPKLQWFINVNERVKIPHSEINGIVSGNEYSLREIMRAATRNDNIKILPNRFQQTYDYWIDGLRDWCISRQIWFGHCIPVWYRGDETYCGIDAPEGDGWIQDEDTLDTWFSSGLWTFSTLGWPEKTKDFVNYHPTTIIETGYDIIFFWVARMILMSGYLLGTVPFRTVYLHGLVRDEKGRKISKSLGNNIDPVDMGTKYGMDAVRLGLIIGTGPGNDSKIGENKIKGYKNFGNKLWNVTRFILTATRNIEYSDDFEKYTDSDMKLRDERHKLIVEITKEMEEYKFYLVAEKIYHYVWHTFADIIIEDSKKIFAGKDEIAIHSRAQFLLHTLHKILRVLHPFMPFITEEIWSMMPFNKEKKLLMVEKWPI